jgi:hypothetical protein
MIDDETDSIEVERPLVRRFVALLVITTAVAQSLGHTLKMPTQLEANDISRWCTVWSLIEHGTYVIDDCPWQNKTQDKVHKVSPFEKDKPGAPEHFYSSKPPLLPTMVAGMVYPFRKLTGVPLDAQVLQERITRTVRKEDPKDPTKVEVVTETPESVKWPVYIFYFKPVIVALNVLPYLAFLILFARMLDRMVRNDWAWFAGLVAAAWGTPLFIFNSTLNNHSVAAYSTFFAVYALMRIWEHNGPKTPYGPRSSSQTSLKEEISGYNGPKTPYGAYASAGFFGAFAACNELPAAALGVLLFLILLIRNVKATLLAFVPAAAIPCAAFLVTLYLATGGLTPFYAEFGGPSYEGYAGAYWASPLEMDYFDKHPEPKGMYLLHMTLGHRGMFSLTPIFLLALPPLLRGLFGADRRVVGLSRLTFVLTVGMLAFYTFKTNNYGGSSQGLRWLFWIFPLWLILVPLGYESGQNHRGMRWLGTICLALSVFSVGYGLRIPWSHPWILDMIEHLNLYTLVR